MSPKKEVPNPTSANARRVVAEAAVNLLRSLDPALTGADWTRLFAAAPASIRAPGPDDAAAGPESGRWQDAAIQQSIPSGARLLDLGCGGGDLLQRLMRERAVYGQGVELNADRVAECVGRSVPVLQMDINEGLHEFPDGHFDYVLLEDTLQTLRNPMVVLREMLRVGRHGIVSFPNFGHWRVRLGLALTGRMPVTPQLPHRWHDTPNIHLFTLQDFLDWCGTAGVHVANGFTMSEGVVRAMQPDDNLMAEEVLLFLKLGD